MNSKTQIFTTSILIAVISAPVAFAGAAEKGQAGTRQATQASDTGNAPATPTDTAPDTYNGECD